MRRMIALSILSVSAALHALDVSAAPRRAASASFNVTVTILRKCTVTMPSAVSSAAAGSLSRGTAVSVRCSVQTPYAMTLSPPPARSIAEKVAPLTLAVTY